MGLMLNHPPTTEEQAQPSAAAVSDRCCIRCLEHAPRYFVCMECGGLLCADCTITHHLGCVEAIISTVMIASEPRNGGIES